MALRFARRLALSSQVAVAHAPASWRKPSPRADVTWQHGRADAPLRGLYMRAALLPAAAGASALRRVRCSRMRLTRSAAAASGGDAWRQNLVTSDADVRSLALAARRVAVLGIKTEAKARIHCIMAGRAHAR